MREVVQKMYAIFICVVATVVFTGCAFSLKESAVQAKAIAAYCPYIASPKTYSPSITVTGHATYDYRIDGNGLIPDGTNVYAPDVLASGGARNFSIDVAGSTLGYNCSSGCTVLSVVDKLTCTRSGLDGNGNIDCPNRTAVIALNAQNISFTYNMTAVWPYRTSGSAAISLTSPSNMTALNARPIRYAEVQVLDSTGTIVQCAETDASGDFSVVLPNGGATYTINVMARASNANNTAYIMNNPTDNSAYKISTAVASTTNTSVNLKASATGTLEGGAFNIMDQIANAQAFLRSKTATCGTGAAPDYFSGCIPVTTIPIVNTYWTPGLTPGVYYGSNGPISYYLNGQSELYILGGVGGNTTVTDMDHFDNSVIVHEYGHFIEDQFGKPNSPGGSHTGNAIIDPRLAWGEGWANYFQAAVSGIPVYRDTTGYVGATSTGVSFKEPLETGTQLTMHDLASTSGEGNFREFSVSRMLWAVSKPSGLSQFSEIWTALNGTSGMRVVSDVFKTIGRLHVIHTSIPAAQSWASGLTTEKQIADFSGYATPFSISSGCTVATSVPMSISVTSSDDGSFAASNQFANNDFYVYTHPGGTFSASIAWSGSGVADLDLYVYKSGYAFGDSSSIVAMDQTENTGTSGTASVSASLPAGTYIINVMAYTGAYTSNGTYSTSYTMNVAGHAACPSNL